MANFAQLLVTSKPMRVEELRDGILILNFAAAGDGGSLFFECKTKKDDVFNLLLTQYSFLECPNLEMLPGRIYLNQKLIALKSKEERHILLGMQNFEVSENLLQNGSNTISDIAKTIKKQIDFFRSNSSIEINRKVNANITTK